MLQAWSKKEMTNLPLTPFRSPSLLFSNPSGFMVGMMWILKNKKMLKSDCFSNGLKVIDMLWGLNVTCVMTTKITSSSQRVSWSCRSSCTTPEGIGSAAKASHVPRPRFRACCRCTWTLELKVAFMQMLLELLLRNVRFLRYTLYFE